MRRTIVVSRDARDAIESVARPSLPTMSLAKSNVITAERHVNKCTEIPLRSPYKTAFMSLYGRHGAKFLGQHSLVHAEVQVHFFLGDSLNEYVDLVGQ
ncbi:hypothetical protein AWB75_06810 [Caballeronia catudaia]|uniref:Uncharacterized protein n=1 Tax=Caballeronia catudaia TaxID=1777136 RepID=A0A158DJ06_9BURK|nr:hypothetical protein AWB75_06810 [Caballeronia catudaia]